MSPFCRISDPGNIEFDVDDLNNFNTFGVYYQNFAGKIIMGSGCLIGPNVGLITANHSFDNRQGHQAGRNIVLGRNVWVGMNAIILPGVEIGDNSVIGAGAVVTCSFPRGNEVIVGNPARVLRELEELR